MIFALNASANLYPCQKIQPSQTVFTAHFYPLPIIAIDDVHDQLLRGDAGMSAALTLVCFYPLEHGLIRGMISLEGWHVLVWCQMGMTCR